MSAWLPRLRRRLAPFRRIGSAADVALVLQCGGFVTVLPLLLRLPLPRLAACLEPRRIPPLAAAPRLERIIELVTAVVEIQRFLPRNCLPRGLARYFFLRRAGAPVVLCFGMGLEDEGDYIAHCWLLMNDEPYHEPRDPRPIYREFYRFPAHGTPVSAGLTGLEPSGR
jgi:hypothetical protein